MDRDYCKPALKAIELGYDLLLEKPIAPTAEESRKTNYVTDVDEYIYDVLNKYNK